MDNLPADVALEVVRRLRDTLAKGGADRVAAITAAGITLDDWFKGELIGIGAAMVKSGAALSARPNLRLTGARRARADLSIMSARQQQVLLAVRHWPIAPTVEKRRGATPSVATAGGAPAAKWLAGGGGGSLRSFIARLPEKLEEDVFLLLVATPRPSQKAWNAGLDAFRKRDDVKDRFTLRSLNRVEEFPAEFAIPLLRFSAK